MKTSLPLRHSIERAPWLRGSLLALLLLACFAVSPLAQAVSPAPDGAYPNGNTAEGTNALFSLTTGSWNTAIGANALYSNTTGFRNNALGVSALLNHKTNNYNNAVGALALEKDTSGNANNAFGDQALINNTIGSSNTGIGDDALLSNTSGVNNTAIGAAALYNNTTGNNNTAVGRGAGIDLIAGSGNVYLGVGARGAASESNTTRIRNIGVTPQNSGVFVTVSAVNGNRLGYVVTASSQRYKEDITPIDRSSEVLFALKPVKFRYKQQVDPDRAERFGLIAEDVEKIDPDLVARDTEGKPNVVRYESINAMLLNEFLKEHRKVEDLKRDFQRQSCSSKSKLKRLLRVCRK
jgi:endosialidase-like protein